MLNTQTKSAHTLLVPKTHEFSQTGCLSPRGSAGITGRKSSNLTGNLAQGPALEEYTFTFVLKN